MRWPLGIFSRGRRDWQIETQEWGENSLSQTGNGGVQVSLNNNDTLGRRLAVYAVIPWSATNPPLVAMGLFQRKDTGQTPAYCPVLYQNPMLSGTVSALARIDTAAVAWGPIFKADGSLIAMPDGSPLFIIPNGAQLIAYAISPWLVNLQSGQLICSFLWGYY